MLGIFNKAKEALTEAGKIADNLFTSKEELGQINIELKKAELAIAEAENNHMQAVLKAENEKRKIESTSWLAMNWRPILFTEITLIIGWHYLIAPILGYEVQELNNNLWTLINVGVGGYTVLLGAGRAAQKIKLSSFKK